MRGETTGTSMSEGEEEEEGEDDEDQQCWGAPPAGGPVSSSFWLFMLYNSYLLWSCNFL